MHLCSSQFAPERSRLVLPKAPIYFLSCILLAVCTVDAASKSQFENLYDHYFPKNDKWQNGEYRQWFDAELSCSPPKPSEDRHRFYSAFHSDPGAFHAFA